jgi:hypothetical protein
MKRVVIGISLVLAAACGNDRVQHPGIALGRALVAACPVAEATDVTAREACADALTELPELREAATQPVLWGGQPDGVPPDALIDQAALTQLEPRVWRRMYLSTFMFEDAPTKMEQHGEYQVLRIGARFRNGLDAGDYPYPFWHSEKKWAAYEQATEVLFVYDGDRIPVAVRTNPDASRPHEPRTWDGIWTWDDGQEPHVSMYTYLFSSTNPHVARLEATYRALEETMREQNCSSCHDPSNSVMVKHLELLTYPNQALDARHDIATLIQANAMPPAVGIPDADARALLIARAMDFATAGDDALAFEGELVSDR